MRVHSEKNYKGRLLRIPPTLTAIVLALGVAGCSILPAMPEMPEMPSLPEMPDWVAPTAWFDQLFRDDDEIVVPGNGFSKSEKPFPKLGEMPKLKAMTSTKERKKISDSLVADRDNSRYTEENLRVDDKQTGLVLKAPLPKVKPLFPENRKPPTVIYSDKSSTSGSVIRRLPLPSTRIIKDRHSLKSVPSIVRRRGGLPLPPTPVEEVSRGQITKIVQKKSSDAVVLGKTVVSKKPPVPKKTLSEIATADRATVKHRTAKSKERVAPDITLQKRTSVYEAPVKLKTETLKDRFIQQS